MDQYPFKMKKHFIMKKMLMTVLLLFVLKAMSIPFLYQGTEAFASDTYEPKERVEGMQNVTMTRENQTNQTADNQTDKIIPGVPEPI
jgi:flagellar basal body-associated protein FliL